MNNFEKTENGLKFTDSASAGFLEEALRAILHRENATQDILEALIIAMGKTQEEKERAWIAVRKAIVEEFPELEGAHFTYNLRSRELTQFDTY